MIGDLPPKGTPLALRETEPGSNTYIPVRKIEVYDTAVLFQGIYKPRNTYATAVLKTVDSKPFGADFKLDENIFKSQQGDLGDIDYDNTVNIAGTLSDDTEFSYDALVK